jgi:hypothetical protein
MLEISDGVGGELELCGSGAAFSKPRRGSRRTKDFYITLTAGPGPFDRFYKGFECKVTCIPENMTVDARPEDDEPAVKEDNTCGRALILMFLCPILT